MLTGTLPLTGAIAAGVTMLDAVRMFWDGLYEARPKTPRDSAVCSVH